MIYESKPKQSIIICILYLHIITSSDFRSINNQSVKLDLFNESIDLVHKTGVNLNESDSVLKFKIIIE